jgi:hypothetical protein
MIVRMIAATSVAALLVFDTLCLLGQIDLGTTLFFNAFVAVALPLVALSHLTQFRGTVTADGAGFKLSARGGSYRWSDVAAVRVTDLSRISGPFSIMFMRALRVKETQSVVQLDLRKRPRVSFLRNRIGTDVTLGMPALSRHLGLYLRDPEEFVRYASTFISPSDPATPA